MPQPVVLAEAAAVALFAASSLSAVAADAGQGKARFWIVSSRLMEVFLEYDIANRFHFKSIEGCVRCQGFVAFAAVNILVSGAGCISC